MYEAVDIAKWFLIEAKDAHYRLSPTQIIKLCFIAQGIHLAMYDEMLFSNSCQAWPYGPVISDIYNRICHYRGHKIRSNEPGILEAQGVHPKDDETQRMLKNTWEVFKNHTAFQLSKWTHRKGSCWDIAYNQEKGKDTLGYEISAKLIKKDFKDNVVGRLHQNQARKYRPNDDKFDTD